MFKTVIQEYALFAAAERYKPPLTENCSSSPGAGRLASAGVKKHTWVCSISSVVLLRVSVYLYMLEHLEGCLGVCWQLFPLSKVMEKSGGKVDFYFHIFLLVFEVWGEPYIKLKEKKELGISIRVKNSVPVF